MPKYDVTYHYLGPRKGKISSSPTTVTATSIKQAKQKYARRTGWRVDQLTAYRVGKPIKRKQKITWRKRRKK